MSAKAKHEPYYALTKAGNAEALREALSVRGLDEEIALVRTRLRDHLEAESPDEGLVLAWINTLARALLAKARIEGAGRARTKKQVAAVVRELGSIFLEDPPQ
jgi:hypothetical protein